MICTKCFIVNFDEYSLYLYLYMYCTHTSYTMLIRWSLKLNASFLRTCVLSWGLNITIYSKAFSKYLKTLQGVQLQSQAASFGRDSKSFDKNWTNTHFFSVIVSCFVKYYPQPHPATAWNMLKPITSPFLLASLVRKALKFCIVFHFIGFMHLSKVNPRVATFWIGTILPLLETRH